MTPKQSHLQKPTPASLSGDITAPFCLDEEGSSTHPVCGEIDSHVRPLQAAALQGLPVISKQGPCNDFPEGFRSPGEFQT